MNVLRTPGTRTVTDASGKTVVVGEASEESKRVLESAAAKYCEALIRLADR